MGQLATRPQPQFSITVLTGADKGSTYQLLDGNIRIGRGEDNDIIIKDDAKISRNHAQLTITPQGVKVTNISDRNTLSVNGKEVSDAQIANGAVIQLGNTRFQFRGPGSSSNPLEALQASVPYGVANLPPSSSRSRGGDPKKTRFYIIVGVIAVFFIWMFNSKIQAKKDVTIRTEEDIQTDITSSNKVVEEVEAEKKRLGMDTRQFEEAQPNFIKGFRDYRKGQYERAIESFQACLSLFPNHQQCQRYLRMSQKKFSELVQYHMVLANKYRAQNQYAACQASYRNVMVMMKNPTDKIYLEAKSGFDACQALEGDRY